MRITRRTMGWLLALLLLVGSGTACGSQGPKVEIEDVWARPAMMAKAGEGQSGPGGMGQGMAGTGAVYMRLANDGREADRLVGAKSDVAKAVEIHETKMDGDVMKMQQLVGGLEVPARGKVLLKPGGYHIMLIGLERDLQVGDKFTLQLQFEKSDTLTVEPEVRQP